MTQQHHNTEILAGYQHVPNFEFCGSLTHTHTPSLISRKYDTQDYTYGVLLSAKFRLHRRMCYPCGARNAKVDRWVIQISAANQPAANNECM